MLKLQGSLNGLIAETPGSTIEGGPILVKPSEEEQGVVEARGSKWGNKGNHLAVEVGTVLSCKVLEKDGRHTGIERRGDKGVVFMEIGNVGIAHGQPLGITEDRHFDIGLSLKKVLQLDEEHLHVVLPGRVEHHDIRAHGAEGTGKRGIGRLQAGEVVADAARLQLLPQGRRECALGTVGVVAVNDDRMSTLEPLGKAAAGGGIKPIRSLIDLENMGVGGQLRCGDGEGNDKHDAVLLAEGRKGFHLLGISGDYNDVSEEYSDAQQIIDGYDAYVEENGSAPTGDFTYSVEDEETLETSDEDADKAALEDAIAQYTDKDYKSDYGAPDTANYGVFIPSIPALVEKGLDALNASDWLKGLILDGIVAGVGAVLGFVPQMLVLFFLLAFLEACGYMARIAFVLDRVFRKFGLSGKSFIPMLVGTGCGVPGIMASRTIENERDRRMTIITTTFIPCGAKVPFIAMIAGAIFGGSPWISVSAYFIGMAAIIVSGIMLKKTTMFSGEPAPFVMELPAYHMPTLSNVLRSMWERGWSFIKKAGSIILISTIVVWFLSRFGTVDGSFGMLDEEQLDSSLLAGFGSLIAWIFAPLGWGNWQAAVASITGLVAKENIVGTMGVLYGGGDGTVWQTLGSKFTSITGFSFLVFNLLCAPCFAAIGAIKREMNNAKWTVFAIAYQCGFAYAVALMITQLGGLFTGESNIFGVIVAAAVLIFMCYMLFVKKYHEASKLTGNVRVKA